MIITPQSFWLSGKPRQILRQLHTLNKGCFYVRDLLEKLYPTAKAPEQ